MDDKWRSRRGFLRGALLTIAGSSLLAGCERQESPGAAERGACAPAIPPGSGCGDVAPSVQVVRSFELGSHATPAFVFRPYRGTHS